MTYIYNTIVPILGPTFAWSKRTEEDGGCIGFGNQELMENILNCTLRW